MASKFVSLQQLQHAHSISPQSNLKSTAMSQRNDGMLPASTLLLIHILMSLVKFGWKGARQCVEGEMQKRDLVQEAKFGRKRARHSVGVETQRPEFD